MVSIRYANAMKEVLQYLKGIRKEDVDKIPKKFMNFLEENASKEHECQFDFAKPLKELDLLDETKGIITIICYKCWCETEEQKQNFLEKLNENEIEYQKQLKEKYDMENIFTKTNVVNSNTDIMVIKKSKVKQLYEKIIRFIETVKNKRKRG